MALKSVNKLITVSESTKKDIIRFLKFEPEKISVIYEGCFFSKGELNPNNYKNNYFLFVGRHEKYKNISTLIEVYSKLPREIKNKYHLIIIGKFNEYTEELKKLAIKKSEEKNILFIDSVSPAVLYDYYINAFLLIHLSFYEGFGLTILEAMNAGIPVIASDRSSIPEILNLKELLVNPENIGQITEKIVKLVNDRDYYNLISKKVFERADSFSWENTAIELMNIFKNHE